MKNVLATGINLVWKTACGIVILPFIAVAFGITKLLGSEPLSMDDMGAGFMMMCAIAGALAIATLAFAIGYFI
jgi:hypothetical protein